MSKKEMTFSEFLAKYYKSYSHGHYFTHEEVDGLFYLKEDYENAEEKYIDYQWDCFIAKLNPLNKGVKHA